MLTPSLLADAGNEALFLPLVFLHVISALAGFGSIGFAGTYASRAAHLQPVDVEPERLPVPGHAGGPEVGAATVEPAVEPAPGLPAPGMPAPAEAVAVDPAAAGAPQPEAPGQDPEVEELTRYFERPARFWKAVLLVPVFGLLALWAQPHTKGLDQTWALGALLVWVAATLVIMGLVVPALGRMRAILLTPAPQSSLVGQASRSARLAQAGAMASRGAAFCDLLFLVALALMIWQP